jgi:hypothetical protein
MELPKLIVEFVTRVSQFGFQRLDANATSRESYPKLWWKIKVRVQGIAAGGIGWHLELLEGGAHKPWGGGGGAHHEGNEHRAAPSE